MKLTLLKIDSYFEKIIIADSTFNALWYFENNQNTNLLDLVEEKKVYGIRLR